MHPPDEGNGWSSRRIPSAARARAARPGTWIRCPPTSSSSCAPAAAVSSGRGQGTRRPPRKRPFTIFTCDHRRHAAPRRELRSHRFTPLDGCACGMLRLGGAERVFELRRGGWPHWERPRPRPRTSAGSSTGPSRRAPPRPTWRQRAPSCGGCRAQEAPLRTGVLYRGRLWPKRSGSKRHMLTRPGALARKALPEQRLSELSGGGL